MTTYEHLCEACGHEWEQIYGMTVSSPTLCPKCGIDGKVKRLISGGSGRCIMRKTAGEIKSNLAIETRAIRKRAETDENFRANLVGEDNYHQQALSTEALTKELVNIGKKASSIKSTDVKPSAIRPKIKMGKGSKNEKYGDI